MYLIRLLLNHVCSTGVGRVSQLVVGLLPRKPRLDHRSTHVGFVVGKVTLGQVLFLRVRRLYCIVPAMLRTHIPFV
jgi:hypothetical protein